MTYATTNDRGTEMRGPNAAGTLEGLTLPPGVASSMGIILVCVFGCYLVFIPRLVHFFAHGRWGETSGAAASAPEFFIAHTVAALTMLAVFVIQPLSGPAALTESKGARTLHRIVGRLFVGTMLLGNAFGLLIMIQHYFFHTGTLMGLFSTGQVAVFSSVFYLVAVAAIRRQDLAGHLENLVFATIVLVTPAGYRLAEDFMVLAGYEHPRAKYLVSVLGISIQSNDLMLIINQLCFILAWSTYALTRGRLWAHPVKLGICAVSLAACVLTLAS